MIRVKIRLYRAHDYDLYVMYRTLGSRKFAGMVREILESYVTGIPYEPEIGIDLNKEITLKEKDIPVTCHLTIKKQPEVEKLLGSIGDNKTSAFVKTVVRGYLFRELAELFLHSPVIVPAIKKEKPAEEKEKKPDIKAEPVVEKREITESPVVETNNAAHEDTAHQVFDKSMFMPKETAFKVEDPDDMPATENDFFELADLFSGISEEN